MKTKKAQLKNIERRIQRIKQRLLALGEMRPGSISKQYNVCGNPTCRCKDKDTPQKHGPYYQLSFVHKGKSSSQFIRPQLLEDAKKQVATYKKFKLLTEEWVDLALQHAKITMELRKENL